MTYDVHLADRIRALLGDEVGVTERRMFGGLAFLVSGNMAVAANSKGALMVRTGADRFDELLDEPGTSMVVMRKTPPGSKAMPGNPRSRASAASITPWASAR